MTEKSFWALRDLVVALNHVKETSAILNDFEKAHDTANVYALRKHVKADFLKLDAAAKEFVETYLANDLKE